MFWFCVLVQGQIEFPAWICSRNLKLGRKKNVFSPLETESRLRLTLHLRQMGRQVVVCLSTCQVHSKYWLVLLIHPYIKKKMATIIEQWRVVSDNHISLSSRYKLVSLVGLIHTYDTFWQSDVNKMYYVASTIVNTSMWTMDKVYHKWMSVR